MNTTPCCPNHWRFDLFNDNIGAGTAHAQMVQQKPYFDAEACNSAERGGGI